MKSFNNLMLIMMLMLMVMVTSMLMLELMLMMMLMLHAVAFNIDDTINRLYQELSTHQQRLDSIEQSRLEMVNFNRLLSFLPKPTLPKEEDGFTHQDTDNSYVDSWGDNRNQYPAV